jgi:hypothetical protein
MVGRITSRITDGRKAKTGDEESGRHLKYFPQSSQPSGPVRQIDDFRTALNNFRDIRDQRVSHH